MTTRLRATYDGRVIIPEGLVDLPVGQVLDLEIVPPNIAASRPLARLAELLEQIPSDPLSPTDAAAQHDHYLYGTPKRENP